MKSFPKRNIQIGFFIKLVYDDSLIEWCTLLLGEDWYPIAPYIMHHLRYRNINRYVLTVTSAKYCKTLQNTAKYKVVIHVGNREDICGTFGVM